MPIADTDACLPNAVFTCLTTALPLLGSCTPLPALYEDVLRAGQGLPVTAARYLGLRTLRAQLIALPGWEDALAAIVCAVEGTREVSLLAATLWAYLQLPQHPLFTLREGNDPLPIAMATLPLTKALPGAMVPTEAGEEVSSIALLTVVHGLWHGTLSYRDFTLCVRYGDILSPEISAQRPLRRRHRLFDYLGFSSHPLFVEYYRRLVAEIWPAATAENWSAWRWVTIPGGPDSLPRAMHAWEQGEQTLPRLHELRYAPLPSATALVNLFSTVSPALRMLLCWLRPEVTKLIASSWLEQLRWLRSSFRAAAQLAYAQLAWWSAWCNEGVPAAREALTWLYGLPLPPDVRDRHAFWSAQYLPDYAHICGNLLLARAAQGEEAEALRLMAADGDLSALGALGLVPDPQEADLAVLHKVLTAGDSPHRATAHAALAQLAHRQGLPGVEELIRQRLLTAAWEVGPLGADRVRTDWQEGSYRLRVALQQGAVSLEVLGPFGKEARVPTLVRRSDAYRQARAAQKAVQAQYRLFKEALEQYLLESTPIAVGQFRYLLENPVFAHLAERLLWRLGDGRDLLWTGEDRWETLAGVPLALRELDSLTLALVHPVTLAAEDRLLPWQMHAAAQRLVQPFKQLFREVYLPVAGETETCERFAGRRITPRRAYALLRTARYAPGNGIARRAWSDGITAHLCWGEGVTGRELFGTHAGVAANTGAIWFTRAGERLLLADVPSLVFSETLRTADLITTRAAVGDADLTSRETLTLRATLLREIARAFGLTNVAVPEEGGYAAVLGSRATYRVNLASGVVFLEPEGRQIVLPAIPPRWQLAEEQDATGEIIAIILTLAHDAEISDAGFLAQFDYAG